MPARPDLVLVPSRDDAHQGHGLLLELAWTAFRDHLVLEYEIPKYDGDLMTPNLYVDLPAWAAEQKVDLLLETFASQRDRSWFSADTFRALSGFGRSRRVRRVAARRGSCAARSCCRAATHAVPRLGSGAAGRRRTGCGLSASEDRPRRPDAGIGSEHRRRARWCRPAPLTSQRGARRSTTRPRGGNERGRHRGGAIW